MMTSFLSTLLTLSFLLQPVATFAQEVPLVPESIPIYYFTTSSTPQLIIAVTPLNEEGNIAFAAVPYEGEVSTNTVELADEVLFDFFYSYDQNDQRALLAEGGYTTIFPNAYFSSTMGSTGTTTKYIYANGLLLMGSATIN